MTELHHAQTIRSDLQQHPRCLHVKHLKERGKKTTNGSQFCLKTTRLPFPIGLFKKGAIISRLTFFTTFIFMLSVTCTSLLMQFILHSSTFKGNNYLYVCKSLTNARHLRPMPILIFERLQFGYFFKQLKIFMYEIHCKHWYQYQNQLHVR